MGRLRTLLTMKVICPFGLQEIALTMLIISDHNCLQRGRPTVNFLARSETGENIGQLPRSVLYGQAAHLETGENKENMGPQNEY